MDLKTPRLTPLDNDSMDPETLAGFGGGPIKNIFRTLARHPDLMKRWLVFGSHVLVQSTLPPRDRELLILRTGWLCQAEYEWSQHAVIGRDAGLTDAEIERIPAGPEADGWSDFDRVQLRAADELHHSRTLSDETWAQLCARYDEKQCLDLLFTVGQYTMVSMVLNSLGVPLDEGLRGFPEDTGGGDASVG